MSCQNHIKAFSVAIASSTDNLLVGVSIGSKFSDNNHDDHIGFLVFGIAVCNAFGSYTASMFGHSVIPYIISTILTAAAVDDNTDSVDHFENGYVTTKSAILTSSCCNILVAIAFLYLAYQEYCCCTNDMNGNTNDDESERCINSETASTTKSKFSTTLPWSKLISLGVPMTLNNLAGGIATGTSSTTSTSSSTSDREEEIIIDIRISPLMASLYVLIVSIITMGSGYWFSRRSRQHFRNNSSSSKLGLCSSSTSWISISLYSILSAMALYDGLCALI